MYQSQHNGTSVTNRDYTPVLSTWNQTPAADQLEMNVRFTSLYNGNIAMMSTNMLYLQEAQNIVASQPVGLGGLQKSHMVNYYKYDQLQRITRMQSTFPQSGDVSLDAYYEAYQYDFNGNIRSLTRNNSLGTTIDALAYKYQTLANNPSQLVSNRLLDVADASMNAAGFKGNKAALNTANQYEYDADGNLTHDAIEGITITWNATGKVSSVTKTDGTYMQFTYDGMGNRISKLVKPAGITKAGYELYVRDAGGNILASYRGEIDTYTPHTTVDNAVVQLETHYIYGSNRIGQNKNTTNTMLNRANIHYELTNHLGNVLVVVTTNKLEIAGGNYIPEIVSTTDYTPFGMQIEERTFSESASSKYPFGMNGQMKDDEIYGEGNAYSAQFWEYDARLGRRWNLDPVDQISISNYATFANNPIANVDPNGDRILYGWLKNPKEALKRYREIRQRDDWNTAEGIKETYGGIFNNNTLAFRRMNDKNYSWGDYKTAKIAKAQYSIMSKTPEYLNESKGYDRNVDIMNSQLAKSNKNNKKDFLIYDKNPVKLRLVISVSENLVSGTSLGGTHQQMIDNVLHETGVPEVSQYNVIRITAPLAIRHQLVDRLNVVHRFREDRIEFDNDNIINDNSKIEFIQRTVTKTKVRID